MMRFVEANRLTNVGVFKRVMWGLLGVSCVVELVWFHDWGAICGVAAALWSTWLYDRFVLQVETVRQRPLSFVAFSALFLFMYLALPATLLDGHPVTYKMYTPVQTFALQSLYYTLAVAAFVWAGRWSGPSHVSWLARGLAWAGYYDRPTLKQLWALGGVGWLFRIIGMSGVFQDGAMGGTLSMFSGFQYAPICTLFCPLWGMPMASRRAQVWAYLYIVFLTIFSLSGNSRSGMLAAIMIWCCGYVLMKLYERTNRIWLNAKKLFVLALGVLVVTGPLNDMATAMLMVRGIRADVSRGELFDRTLSAFQDKEDMARFRAAAAAKTAQADNSMLAASDWGEEYVSNLFLGRFCNYRVVDATIYHADRVGYAHPTMQEEFVARLQTMFPGPIARFLFPSQDKKTLRHSSMDRLYNLSHHGAPMGGFKVGGDVGLGLAVFGWWYFPLVLLIYACIFAIFDSLTLYRKGKPFFPFFVISQVYFTYFLTFTVANGMQGHFSYLLWSFWWGTFWLLLVYRIVRFLFPAEEAPSAARWPAAAQNHPTA